MAEHDTTCPDTDPCHDQERFESDSDQFFSVPV